MKKTLVIGGIAATAVLVAGWALAQSPGYGPGFGPPGGFGPGYGFMRDGGPHGMGPGMMGDRGRGWGPGYRQDEGRGWGPGMGPMHRMGRGMMGGGPGSFLDTERLDAVKRDLAVTPAQEAVWIKYSKAVQDAAAAAKETRSSVDTDAVAKMSRAERYDFFAKLHEQRWQQHQAVRTAARELFATLDEKQKDVAEDVLPGLGGFGPGMMHGGRGGPGYGWR